MLIFICKFKCKVRRVLYTLRCIARMKTAGAILVGKTDTTEFASFSANSSHNPHDPSRTPGGSSSGSAAAVADMHVPIAFGTQTNGSVIRPAGFCGVCGFKGTYGWADCTGIYCMVRVGCCLLCLYMPALDRSLSDCSLVYIHAGA